MVNKQDFLNSITEDITMVRGDTLAFSFILEGLESYEDLRVSFAVVEHYNDVPIILVDNDNGITLESVTEGKALFTVGVAPEFTRDMELGRYYYDLSFTDGDNVVTLMRGHFTLVYDVRKG